MKFAHVILTSASNKSGLLWKKNQVTPGKCELRESATENIPPTEKIGNVEMVR